MGTLNDDRIIARAQKAEVRKRESLPTAISLLVSP